MKKISISILIFLVIFMSISMCFANAAEPPSVVIIVINGPDDLELSLVESDGDHPYEKSMTSSGMYFATFEKPLELKGQFRLVSADQNVLFDYEITEHTYYSTYTLDYKNMTFKEGHDPIRMAMRISARVILTLLLEGILFLVWGYRKKISWLVFFAVNVITQGYLNYGLVKITPYNSYGLIFTLIIFEFFILIIELVFLTLFIKEKSKGKTVIYVILANLLSLFIGGSLIQMLPI